MRCLPALLACAICLPRPSAAQQWHTTDISRQLRDTAALHVHVTYGGGVLAIRGTGDSVLFGMHLRYDGLKGAPLHTYDARDHTLAIGLSGQEIRLAHQTGSAPPGEMRLQLSRRVPIDLVVDMGAVTADMDLGGLRLSAASIHAGAAQGTLRFSAPNTARMSLLEFDAGAAGLAVTGLANANAATIQMHAGVGAIDVTFDGTWTQDITLDVAAYLGKVTVRVPSDVGVQVDIARRLGTFEQADLVKRGDSYVSTNWDRARFKLHVRGATVLGDLDIERVMR